MVLPPGRFGMLLAIAPAGFLAGSAFAISTPPEVALSLPADTAYVILLDMQPDTWQQLNQFALFQTLQAQGEAPPSPGGLPFLPPELDYAADIAPWVGDTTAFALLPLDTPRATQIAEHEVLLAPIAKAPAFVGFVDTVTALRGVEPATQTFQSVPILVWEPEFWDPEEAPEVIPPVIPLNEITALPAEVPEFSWPADPFLEVPGLAIAVLPDLLVAAEHPAAIRAWLAQRPDTAAASLATQPQFQRTLAHPQYEAALGAFYGNLGEMVKFSLVDLNLPALPLPIPLPEAVTPEELAQLAAWQLDSSLEAWVYPTQQGLRLQGRAHFDDTLLRSLATTWQPISGATLKTVPGNAYGLFSSRNLAALWQQLAAALEAGEVTAEYLNEARNFFQLFTGLDLDRDFFAWMDGDFTVFLFPTEKTPLTLFTEDLPIGLGIALQTSDRAAAEYAFEQLDTTLGAGLVTVEDQVLGTQTISSWSSDLNGDNLPDSFLGHGWASEDTFLVTTSVESLADILTMAPAQAVPNSLTFLRSTQDFPTVNQGYLFTNVNSLRSLFYRFLPLATDTSEDQVFRQTLAQVQSLSGTLSATEDYVQIDGLLLLTPAAP